MVATFDLTEVTGTTIPVVRFRLTEAAGVVSSVKFQLTEASGSYNAAKFRLTEASAAYTLTGSAPTCDAGSDLDVSAGETWTLAATETSGGASIASRAWRQVSKTDPTAPDLVLSSTTVLQPTFAAPVTTDGCGYVLGLIVTDSVLRPSDESQASITVRGADLFLAETAGWIPAGVLLATSTGWR